MSLPTSIAGLWLGETTPAPELQGSVPTNPIYWSLTLRHKTGPGPSAFGGGYFEDCNDVPGSPVLLFTLSGDWDPVTGSIKLTKQYLSRQIAEQVVVVFEGILSLTDGLYVLNGTWTNVNKGSHGRFLCHHEPTSVSVIKRTAPTLEIMPGGI